MMYSVENGSRRTADSFLFGHESGHSIARPIALRATGSHPGGRSSEELPACCPGQQCSSPLRSPPVKMCLERSAERNKHKNIKIIFR